jgi:hypothetical protein
MYVAAKAPVSLTDDPPGTMRQTVSATEEETAMNRRIVFIALSVVIGGASAALAGSEREVGPRGYQVQTWQDIERDRQDIQRQIDQLYHTGNAGNADGYVAVPKKHVRHVSHKPTQDR